MIATLSLKMKNPGASPQAPVWDYPPLAPAPKQPLAFRLAPLGYESGVSGFVLFHSQTNPDKLICPSTWSTLYILLYSSPWFFT